MTGPTTRPMTGQMTGAGIFLRTFVRRDRWLVLWWGIGATLLYYSQAVSVDDLYATQAEFDRAAAAMQHNAAFIAMAGPPRALNTIGGQVTCPPIVLSARAGPAMAMNAALPLISAAARSNSAWVR